MRRADGWLAGLCGLILLSMLACFSHDHSADIPDKADELPKMGTPSPSPTPEKTACDMENDSLKSELDSCWDRVRAFKCYTPSEDYDGI